MRTHHEIGMPESGGEKERTFELNLVEKCALQIALTRTSEIADGINNRQREVEDKRVIDLRFKALTNIKNGIFMESPELSQLYLNAAIDERDTLTLIKNQKGGADIKLCGDHRIDDHIKALDSLIDFFQKRLVKEYN